MGSAWLSHGRIAARAVVTRMRITSLMADTPLPDVLRALSPDDDAEVVPLEVVERALSLSERVVGRLRLAPNTCLFRALTRYAMLRNAGYPARFVMALDGHSPELVGHAWVELDGRPLGEKIEPRFRVTFAYPESSC